MVSARIACVVVPLFPLAARLRSEPGLAGAAVAVFEGNGNAARVVAATRSARRAGIQPGQTLPQARALLPDLLARGRDRESERAAQEALTEVADGFSPRVESTDEGVVYFDAVGIPLPVGEGDAEARLGRAVIAAVEKAGLAARFGIAASKLAARVAAGLPDSPTVVPEGEEARFLAPLPLARLAPEMELADTLERWGIRSIGELARLPEGEVASRLGELGRELHATARGVDPRPLEPRLPSPCLSEGMELEWPLVSLEPFLFVGNAALERLVRRLEAQGLACRRLEVGLKLDPEGYDARAITLPAPTRDVKTLLTLTRLELEARPPGAPVVGFTFTARPDRARQAQLALFGPAALSPDRLATTIARLVAMLGAERVGSPRAVDGHVPERLAVADYSPPPPPLERRAPRTGRGLLAIRVLRPPVELEVTAEGRHPERSSACHPERTSACHPERSEGSGASLRLLSLKSANGGEPEISGAVRVAAGPWNLEEGWWSAAPASRDYWDVELAAGGLYRIYRDRASDKWYADGMYD
jgi:protein ImuB